MHTKRRMANMVGALVLASTVAQAQNPIQWVSRGTQGIAIAKKRQMPLMFYVTGTSGDVESEISEAQNRAFRDPIVLQIARERFVPVRLARTSDSIPILEEFKLPTDYGLYVALVAPDGELLDQVSPTEVARPGLLADRMTAAFRAYRDKRFHAEVKPVLENENADVNDVRLALSVVEKLQILIADQALVGLLGREDLPKPVRKQALELLAELPTQAGIEALLNAASSDRQVATILSRADLGATEYLLTHLGDANQSTHILAYQALTAICKVPRPKPAGFWDSDNEHLKKEEIARVKKAAEKVFDRWKEQVGKYR